MLVATFSLSLVSVRKGLALGCILRFSLHHRHPLVPRSFEIGPIMFVHWIRRRQLETLEVYELSMLLNAKV
jgi:hypothetical protein